MVDESRVVDPVRSERLRHRADRRAQLERLARADVAGLAALGSFYAAIGRIRRAPDLCEPEHLVEAILAADCGPELRVVGAAGGKAA